MSLLSRISIPLSLAVTLCVSSVAHAECETLRFDVLAAQAENDLPRMRELHADVMVDAQCSDALRNWLSNRIAYSLIQQAGAAFQGGTPMSDLAPVLEDSLRYAPTWQAHSMLGDIAYEEQNYPAASAQYQRALVAINDEFVTPDAPPTDRIAFIYERAEITRLLSDEYIEAPVTRSGAPGGLGEVNFRGFTVQSVQVPVRFEFGSTDFTPDGRAAAIDLLTSLRSAGSPDIVLIGHTDPVGDRNYNQALSEERAKSVADFLRREGYRGGIRIEGRGEDAPLQIPDAERFSRDQIHQMLRRVEVVR